MSKPSCMNSATVMFTPSMKSFVRYSGGMSASVAENVIDAGQGSRSA